MEGTPDQGPPPLPPHVPPLPRKEEGAGKYWLFASVGCLLFLVLAAAITFFFYYVFKATADPLKVVNQQLEAVRAGDLDKAYSYCSIGFKQTTNYESFRNFISSYPQMKTSREFTSLNRDISNGTAKLKGNLNGTDGSTTAAEYHLVREARNWRIQYIDLGSAGATQQNAPVQTPHQVKATAPAQEEVSTGNLRIEEIAIEHSQQADAQVVKIQFKVFGFATDRTTDSPRIHLVQDLQTFGPDGNLIPELSMDSIKDLQESGEFGHVSMWNSLPLSSSAPRGLYQCRFVVHDRIGGTDAESNAEFTLE